MEKSIFRVYKFDDEAEILHGEVINIRDVITFQATSVVELQTAFRESVDDYLEFCAERGEEPDKPFSGRFILRLAPEQHRLIATVAKISGKSLNAWVTEHIHRDAEQELGLLGSKIHKLVDPVR